ncbi:MAG TPA: hypothetical protein VFP23_02265 [Solirubrobacterales bacterium]|nr:hypothetical protein [Solirubrobacterales bacterium]
MSQEMATRSHAASLPRGIAAALIFLVMLLAALSLWTAIPLSWIYIGSKVSHTQFPSQGPYLVVAVGIVLTVLIDAWLIARLNHLYMRITGTNRLSPMRPGWLKSVRDTEAPVGNTTVVEAVLMGSVILAVAAFTAWFFILAGSPIPNQ